MSIFKVKKHLNGKNLIDELNSKSISDYDILYHYVPEFKGWGKIRSNIRHNDKDASLQFTYRNGKASISDFGTTHLGMTVFQYLSLYLSVSEETVYKAINRDFNLGLDDTYSQREKVSVIPQKEGKRLFRKEEESEPWDIRYTSRRWGSWKIDREFWYDGGGISVKTLNLFNVLPATHYWLRNSKTEVGFIASEESPTYIYLPDKSLDIKGYKRKVYNPFKQEGKWHNSLPNTACLALHTLPAYGNTLLIQTSLKDTMTCFELFKDEDIWNVDLFSESKFLSNELFLTLQRRFKRIIIFGDNDTTGVRQATQFSQENGIKYTHFPVEYTEKDPYGMVRSKGQDFTKKLMLELINN